MTDHEMAKLLNRAVDAVLLDPAAVVYLKRHGQPAAVVLNVRRWSEVAKVAGYVQVKKSTP